MRYLVYIAIDGVFSLDSLDAWIIWTIWMYRLHALDTDPYVTALQDYFFKIPVIVTDKYYNLAVYMSCILSMTNTSYVHIYAKVRGIQTQSFKFQQFLFIE